MHTTKINNTSFIHNGDYEGDIEIVIGEKRLMRDEKIARLEQASDDEVLNLVN